jgi:hypothetical protein
MIQALLPTSSDSTSKETSARSPGTQAVEENLSGTRVPHQLSLRPRSKRSSVLNLQPLLLPGDFSPQQKEMIGSWLLNELASGSTVTISGSGIHELEIASSSPLSSELRGSA